MHVEISNKAEKFAELDRYIDGLGKVNDGMLIRVLHKAQHIFDFLPEEVQNHVAKRLCVPASKVYGVVTFYSFFNMTPKGKVRVNICTGTACFVRGCQKIVDEFVNEMKCDPGMTTDDGMFSLDCLRCVGACGLAPVLSVNGTTYGRVKAEDVKGIIETEVAKLKEGVA
jgi:NADH:ubiquinone oxidoreductase subunit E